MSKLIIAEKPSVAKSIASALGASSRADGFYEGSGLLVSWCVGHLVSPMDAGGYDERFKKWRYDDLPILPEPFRYVLAPGKEDAFENLRALMNRPDVDIIVNACDAGREGELIFRLVYEMTGCRKPILRLWISSMEDSAIREGFSDLRPGTDYEALYQSALCRQKADWLVGINATRLFSVLYHRTLNVGRVQTPTLAMLAERDAKITLFHKEKYHLLRLTLDGTEAVSEKFTDPTEAEQAAAMCKDVTVTCTSVTKEQKKEQPPKLYDLTTLQREANRLFGYTAKQTLDYAQSLYEKKLLTYPRTDSRHLTSDMAETASCVIHLAAKVPPFDGISNFFPLVEAMISDKDVSDHHAIIPTMEIEKADLKLLPVGERNLLLLVCCKLLCASAEPYEYEAVTATFDCGEHAFTAKGGADPDTFMDGIRTMVQEIVSTYSCISEDGKKLFAPEKEVIGTCPRCGQPVYEGKKNFACSDRSCGFVLWKNDRFWTSRKKELTKKMATDLLKKGRANVKGMWSEKKQATYDATVILDDTGGKYINFKLEFPKRKVGADGRK